ncbi:MAG: transcriptional regulator/sugar kinase [Planctomycetota bacterium]|nr:transcriptional regulator/sugar kinase [Planctomycetota bacterium]
MSDRGMGSLVAGVDLGGTKVLASIVDAENRILGRAKASTPATQGGAAILAAVAGVVREAAVEANVELSDLKGIVVGSPGPLDPDHGVILFSANMNVRDFALGPDLSRLLGPPVLLRNDVRVGGYGEFRLGAGKGKSNVLAAFVGTGIGGCLIVDGKVIAGSTGNAGEIGHIMIKPGGPRCGCGRRGCLEALASRSAIAKRIGKAHKAGRSTVLASKVDSKNDKLKSKELAAAYLSGDAVAVSEVHRAAHYLGLGLGSLINVLGPELVIIGGGVTEALGVGYLDAIRASAWNQVLTNPGNKIQIVPAALGDDAGILGAALMAREAFC